jgi:hypothetical protein
MDLADLVRALAQWQLAVQPIAVAPAGAGALQISGLD